MSETIEGTDRYEALGIEPSGCDGPCEGTGVVPVYAPPWLVAKFQEGGRAAPGPETDPQLQCPTTDGWHFVRCPTCQPFPA